jgi:hypothetical protein
LATVAAGVPATRAVARDTALAVTDEEIEKDTNKTREDPPGFYFAMKQLLNAIENVIRMVQRICHSEE